MSPVEPSPAPEPPPPEAAPQRTLPVLRVLAGPDLLRFVTLPPLRHLCIGRDAHSELPLTHATVSKSHARLEVDARGAVTVLDLKSTNGTTVNGRRVRRSPLLVGDHLELGDVPLRIDRLTHDELRHLARVCERFEAPDRDPVTGLTRPDFLRQALPGLVDRCSAAASPLSCLHIRLDRLCDIHDVHGPQTAASVVRGAAKIIGLGIRGMDPCIAESAETVFVFLQSSGLADACRVADRIRRSIAAHDWHRDARGALVTASIGVATHLPSEGIDDWLGRARTASQYAGATGRNRVERALPSGLQTPPTAPGM